MNFRRAIFLFGLLFIVLFAVAGCGGFSDRRTIWKSKRTLAQREKDLEELKDIRGRLRRIIEMKIKAVQLLESTNRVLASKYIELGSYNLARDALEEAEYLNPHNPFIKKDLGECYYFLGRASIELESKENNFALSRKYFLASLDLKPDLIEARYGLGLLLFFGYEEVSGAIEEMKKILEFEPDNVEAHFALGRFYYEIDELGKSLGEYITLTRILPKGSEKKKKAEENILKINRELGLNE